MRRSTRHTLIAGAAFALASSGAGCADGPSTALVPVTMVDAGDSGTYCVDGATCDAAPPPSACDGSTGSCVTPESVPAGKPCTFTADCKAGYYCGADGTCDPAGTALVGATCTTSGSCVRGAVCYHASPGLYGVCALPDGVSITEIVDGGVDGAGEGGVIHGPKGTAHGIGGACKTVLDCLAGLACDATTQTCEPGVPGAGLPAPWPGAVCNDALPADAGAAVRAYFEVPAADGTPPYDFFRLPFPNDVRRDPTSHKINLTGFPHPGTALLGFDIVELYAQESEKDLDGFGTNQTVYFRFSGAVDLNSLTVGTGGSVQMYDLTAGGPVDSVGFSASTAGNRYICGNNITIGTTPMVPGHTYAVTLSTAVKDMNNKPVARDAQFGPMLAASAPSGATLAAAYAAYAPLRSFLASQGIDPSTILDATVFTTQHATSELPLLRTAVLAQPAPKATGFVRCDTGVVSPCDDGLTGAAHVRGCIGPASAEFDELQGKITIPIMQQGTRPYSTLGQGAIVLDSNGAPVVQGTEEVCVSITVPHGVTPPAGGWPVVLYAHGTGGFYRSGILEGLAAAVTNVSLGSASGSGTGSASASSSASGSSSGSGSASASASSSGSGSASGSSSALDAGSGPPPTSIQFAFVGYDGVMSGPRAGSNVTQDPDTLFFNFANPVAARDNVLQGAADVFALVNALGTVSLPGLPAAGDTTAFDPKRIYFIGHSQGSTVGLPASAFEPHLAGMVFSGAGGDLRQSLLNKKSPVDIADLTPVVLEDPSVDVTHPALNMLQAFIERSDAVNYGGLLLSNLPMGSTARPLVQTYGLGDTYAPIPTLQAVASAIGLSAAGPVPGSPPWPSAMGLALPVTGNVSTTSGQVTAALLEADPMGAYDGHFVLFDDPTLQKRVMQFLGTAATGTPTIE